jgi:hypothetical protein
MGNYYRLGALRTRQECFLLVLAAATVALVWFQDSSAPSLLDEPSRQGYLSPLSPQQQALRRSSVDDGNGNNNRTAASAGSAPYSIREGGAAAHLQSDAARVQGAESAMAGAAVTEEDRQAATSRRFDGKGSKDSIDPADRSVRDEFTANAAPGVAKEGARDNRPTLKDSGDQTASSEKPASPYETRWPGYKLPVWSRKARHGKTPERSVCFVHVGKAAGSSVGCSLGFQLHCPDEFLDVTVPGLLPSSTTNMMHNDVNDCALDHHYYMFTMRNPVERIKSWWLYDLRHLDRLRKGSCPFRTLNDLAEVGLSQQPYRTTKECHKMAMAVVRGEQKEGNHAYHNYRWYLQQVPFNATIAAIRAEHMLDDWNAMERHLATAASMAEEPIVIRELPTANENKRSYPSEKYVSAQGRSWLCAALCDEIQVYKHILSRAVNLQPSDVQQSLQELRDTCPFETDQAACPK